MSNERHTEGYLSWHRTLALIELLRSKSESLDRQSLIVSARARVGGSIPSIVNTIELLENVGHFQGATESVSVREGLTRSEAALFSEIQGWVFDQLLSILINPTCARCFQWRNTDNTLWADRNVIPGRASGLPFLLREFSVIAPLAVHDRHWQVNPSFCQRILTNLSDINDTPVLRHGRSLSELDKQLEAQRLAGASAERWVLSLELQRLEAHPLRDSVCMISEEYVDAGYDIKSFSSNSVLIHDKFIEVKSYTDWPSFYWSKNEWTTARRFGAKYYLYIVDRNKLADDSYKPIIIQNPYKTLFVHGTSNWRREHTSVRFEQVAEARY